jgi:hypothetical protein
MESRPISVTRPIFRPVPNVKAPRAGRGIAYLVG